MHRISAARLWAFFVSAGAGFYLAGAPLIASEQTVAGKSLKPTLGYAVKHGESKPLRDFKLQGPLSPQPKRQIRNETALPKKRSANPATDRVLQDRFGVSQPAELGQFDGGSEADNATLGISIVVPPDTNGDVGPKHYVQFLNTFVNIYDKTGTLVDGPFPGNAPFEGFGGPCEANNDGDPIAKYDRMADRWVLTQFAVPNYPAGPSYQCFAVSKTGDPAGAYWLYEFTIGSLAAGWGDYPKLGIWPDGYYIAFNMFTASAFNGMGAYAFDRSAMLNGAPATSISFQPFDGGGLPSDLDGLTLPPDGSPNYFLTPWNNSPGTLNIYQFHVDWATPANSTFSDAVAIPVADWLIPCGFGPCVPQLGSSELLDTLSDRLMYRLAYRNFGDHESLVTNETVSTPGGQTAVRWFEIRDPGGSPAVYQEGSYSPDSSFRWMGSIAMDNNENMALGYSKSSSTEHPSIAITGRLAGDPLNTMGSEDVFFSGAGSQQNSFNRWGDYSSMSIDSTDDCTFWYTQEYYATTTDFDFKTRIGSFKFPGCTSPPGGSITGSVTDGSNPVAGALVTAGPYSRITDASGSYAFSNLPVGTYDMTASKFGYTSAGASGVSVADGTSTVENFAITSFGPIDVNGIVKDGSGGGWPLYAKVVISSTGGTDTLYTDPVTGYYATTLIQGVSYTFVVTAVSGGYLPGGGTLSFGAAGPTAPGAAVQNWDLLADLQACSAPGYGGTMHQSFDSGALPAGWNMVTAPNSETWTFPLVQDACDTPNNTGGSGGFAIFDSGCVDLVSDDSAIVGPTVNLTNASSPVVQWNTEFNATPFFGVATADVDVSTDAGTSWTNVWEKVGFEQSVYGPSLQTVDISSLAAGQASVAARFRFQGFWAGWWQVDNVLLGDVAGSCAALPGGLVVGNVTDSNTGLGLVGAQVKNLPNDGIALTTSDPGQGDGFYILFAGSGSQPFEASKAKYAPQDQSALVIPSTTVRLNFSLAAGRLDASPKPISSFVTPGGTDLKTLTMSNTGGAPAGFVIHELNLPAVQAGAAPTRRFFNGAEVKAALQRLGKVGSRNTAGSSARSAKGLPPMPNAPTQVPALAAGNVIAAYPTDIAYGWGVAYDTDANNPWISNPSFGLSGFGDDKDYQYTSYGALTGNTIDDSPLALGFAADGTYNQRTGMIWRLNDNFDDTKSCIFELDPVSMVTTGRSICPAFVSSQRGLAYDYVTNTYLAGGWNDGVIYRFDETGAILESTFVGLNISGLAYNPTTGHLFVMTNDYATAPDVYVLDTRNSYLLLGAFKVISGGSAVFTDGSGAGMDNDCDGNLWVVDQNSQMIYKVASGETGWCVNDVPWLSETPTEGTVPSGGGGGHGRPSLTAGTSPVTLHFDSLSLHPGLRLGSVFFSTDTPYTVAPVPVNFTVLFSDVPLAGPGSFAQSFIYGAAGAGIMPGCAPQTPSFDFCPSDFVTRRSMAGFIERAVHGPLTPPPVYQGEFDDVLLGSFNADYIQGLVDDGITAGCNTTPPLYCPDTQIPREQMAVFILLAEHGGSYRPPDCTTQIFDDVPCSSQFAPWVNQLFTEGITAGCSTSPALFCPNPAASTPPSNGLATNAQMAVYLSVAFKIPHL